MKTTTWLALCVLLCVVSGLSVFSCDEGYQSPVDRPECVEGDATSGCGDGQICLVSRCYSQCTSDSDCSRWERCTGGVCASSTIPQGDADIPTPDGDGDGDADGDGDGDGDADGDGDGDADGDADADADQDADEPGPGCDTCPERCHGAAEVCVECVDFGQCLLSPLCDIARGMCIEPVAGQCAPCNPIIPQCGAGLECVDRRSSMSAWEVVCLTPCATGCPQGTTCGSDGLYCVPTTGVSCTAWYANSAGRTCAARTDCLPLGADPSLVECSAFGACTLNCTDTSQCPPFRTCGADSFCQ